VLHTSATSNTVIISYPPSSAVVDMQLHRPDGFETGSDNQLDIFSQRPVFCELDAIRQVSRLSDDDNENTVDVLAHPLASASPEASRLARVTSLTLVMRYIPDRSSHRFLKVFYIDHKLMVEFGYMWLSANFTLHRAPRL
jgi:hypothetical protein